jgi:predicted DNA-binding transcriptional regulator AlpA
MAATTTERGLRLPEVVARLGMSRAWIYLGGHPKPAINGHLKTGHYG